jgi:cyclopropane fatty-acyl-phospholipid synthase-like methyltransferase
MKKLTRNEEVYALLHAPAASAALGTAIVTGLLWMLAEKPMSGEEVVRALNVPGKRGHYWLQFLGALGILDTAPQGYIPSPLARSAILETKSRESWAHLVIDEGEKDACVHGLPQLIGTPGSLWTLQGLAEPASYVDRMRASPDRARDFTRMLFEVHQSLADQVAELLDLTGVERMMDLGGNSGVVSMALLRKYPSLTSTVVDIENVCVAGREIAAEQGFTDRITYHAAEFSGNEFPSGFDLILQCDVGVYGLELFRKLAHSLRPGGRMVFVDHFSPAENLAPPARVEWTFLDSLRDPDFGYPTLAELKSMLVQAGFEPSDEHQILGKGLVVLQAWKRNGDSGSAYENR